jgi:hypothetical protein
VKIILKIILHGLASSSKLTLYKVSALKRLVSEDSGPGELKSARRDP